MNGIEQLAVVGHSLFKSGERVETWHGGRLVVNVDGLTYDAAGMVYFLTFGVWPKCKPQFFNRLKDDLTPSNLAISRARRRVREDHLLNVPKCTLTEPQPNCVKRIATPTYLKWHEGRQWKTYKGQWVSIPLASGPWDDWMVRAQAVVDSDVKEYLHAIRT